MSSVHYYKKYETVASIGTMIGGLIVKDFSKLDEVKQISLIWLLGSVVTDAMITVSLVSFLVSDVYTVPFVDLQVLSHM